MTLHDELSQLLAKHPRPRRYVRNYEELSDNIIFYRKMLDIPADALKAYLQKHDHASRGYQPRELYELSLAHILLLPDLFGISLEELLTYHPWNDNIAYGDADEPIE